MASWHAYLERLRLRLSRDPVEVATAIAGYRRSLGAARGAQAAARARQGRGRWTPPKTPTEPVRPRSHAANPCLHCAIRPLAASLHHRGGFTMKSFDRDGGMASVRTRSRCKGCRGTGRGRSRMVLWCATPAKSAMRQAGHQCCTSGFGLASVAPHRGRRGGRSWRAEGRHRAPLGVREIHLSSATCLLWTRPLKANDPTPRFQSASLRCANSSHSSHWSRLSCRVNCGLSPISSANR
jgi:hypothetical protein